MYRFNYGEMFLFLHHFKLYSAWKINFFCKITKDKHFNQVSDHLFVSSQDDSGSSTPKSDSELTNQTNPEIQWTWGELPHAAQVLTHMIKLATANCCFPVYSLFIYFTSFFLINKTTSAYLVLF